MGLFKRLLPDALAGRIVLLLAIALLSANAVALVVLGVEQRRFDRHATEDRVIERVVDLVSAMEAVGAQSRKGIARDASSRFARVRVEKAPLLRKTGTGSRSEYIAAQLSEALERDDVLVDIIERPHRSEGAGRRHRGRSGGFIGVSAPLSAQGEQPQWLNVLASGASPRHRHLDGKPFIIVLALSLLSVLGVALVVARRLTKP